MNDTTNLVIPDHVHKIIVVKEMRSDGLFFRLRFVDSEGEGINHRFPAQQAKALAQQLEHSGFTSQPIPDVPNARLFIR